MTRLAVALTRALVHDVARQLDRTRLPHVPAPRPAWVHPAMMWPADGSSHHPPTGQGAYPVPTDSHTHKGTR